MSEQTNSQYLFMTDERIAEHKRKQAEMHARLIAAFPEPKSDKQRIAELEAAVLEAQIKQEPVAWCVAYDDPRMGRIHSNPTMCEPEVDVHVSKCGGVVVKAPLFAAPVVQPDMVMVPREPTVAMREAIESSAVVTFSRTKAIYAAMIAAAEGKSNA